MPPPTRCASRSPTCSAGPAPSRDGRRSRARLPTSATASREVPADGAGRSSIGTLERIAEGIVVARRSCTLRGTALCSRCLQPVAGDVAVHVDELFETDPLDGETYLSTTTPRPRSRSCATPSLLELPAAPLCRRRLRGPLPELRRRPQRHRRATAKSTNPTPAGRPCGRSTSELEEPAEWPSRSAR